MRQLLNTDLILISEITKEKYKIYECDGNLYIKSGHKLIEVSYLLNLFKIIKR